MTPRSSQAVDAAYCAACGCYLNGGMIARSVRDSRLCVECDDDYGQVATCDPSFYPGLVE